MSKGFEGLDSKDIRRMSSAEMHRRGIEQFGHRGWLMFKFQAVLPHLVLALIITAGYGLSRLLTWMFP